jgi:hypothetical protein
MACEVHHLRCWGNRNIFFSFASVVDFHTSMLSRQRRSVVSRCRVAIGHERYVSFDPQTARRQPESILGYRTEHVGCSGERNSAALFVDAAPRALAADWASER